jgi:hypothetical protein
MRTGFVFWFHRVALLLPRCIVRSMRLLALLYILLTRFSLLARDVRLAARAVIFLTRFTARLGAVAISVFAFTSFG